MNEPETEEREILVQEEPGGSAAIAAVKTDNFDAIIELSEKADKIAAALDKFRKVVLSRALPGDWVAFGAKVECSGAGAERMRSIAGIGFVNWKSWREDWEDENGKALTWWYQADMTVNGKVIMEGIQNRQSSRDKFFGYENGAWKRLSEVKESDIRMAARRGVIKEGTKTFFGLRSLPNDPEVLTALGLDPKKIKAVEYGQRGEKATNAEPSGSVVVLKEIKAFNGKNKKTQKPYTRYDIFDTNGAKYSTFDKNVAEFAKGAKESGAKVVIEYEVGKFGNDIQSITPAPADAGEKGEPKS